LIIEVFSCHSSSKNCHGPSKKLLRLEVMGDPKISQKNQLWHVLKRIFRSKICNLGHEKIILQYFEMKFDTHVKKTKCGLRIFFGIKKCSGGFTRELQRNNVSTGFPMGFERLK
jgi:hypothetical protein